MRKRGVTCLVIGALLVVFVLACAVVLFTGLDRLAKSLPTPQARPTLTIGQTYWIGALLPPPGLPAGLRIPNADLYNKPGTSLSDPSVTIVAVLGDATPVKLGGIRNEWCYVEGTDEFGKHVEGWLRCDRLLDYKPTPVPTLNLTPQKP